LRFVGTSVSHTAAFVTLRGHQASFLRPQRSLQSFSTQVVVTTWAGIVGVTVNLPVYRGCIPIFPQSSMVLSDSHSSCHRKPLKVRDNNQQRAKRTRHSCEQLKLLVTLRGHQARFCAQRSLQSFSTQDVVTTWAGIVGVTVNSPVYRGCVPIFPQSLEFLSDSHSSHRANLQKAEIHDNR